MDSLQRFFEEQQAIMEMSDEDDEIYQLRVSGTNKRYLVMRLFFAGTFLTVGRYPLAWFYTDED